ncbi:MAG: adenosylcobalamin-dependent ribonucleoside-diphosphate reductase, partial [Planctomycetes bacterium]|nr:adenosylcobalamin-dependent ribonucleoside-diphosphate reductase [Planctomycetota bacterium]
MNAELSRNARIVLERRYLKKDAKGRPVESPDDMFWRVARNVAEADKLYSKRADVGRTAEQFHALLANLEFLPNSPTLMNAGRTLQQLSACFVLPVEDSIEAMFDILKYTALIHQSGGGTGFAFSRVRPKGDLVSSSGGKASGPISFMRVFDQTTEAINQGGFRRGANMAILRVDHPDIFEFIEAKNTEGQLRNFNLSVGVTDAFIRAVERGQSFWLVSPRTQRRVRRVAARRLFEAIVDSAWHNGEPGVVFLDTLNATNPTPALGPIEATNPCAEQPLLPFESCNLGSINLTRMLDGRLIDYEKLAATVATAIHFLDNVVDMSRFPLPQIEALTRGNRKIGLGVMGFADLLIRLGVRYDTDEALRVAEELMRFISVEANRASLALAEKRGVFPNFKKSIYNRPGGPRYRNATRTTVAPTGTLSIIAGCSSGIEPLFAVSYIRNVLDGEKLPEVQPDFAAMLKQRGLYSAKLMARVAESRAIRGIAEIPQDMRRLFVTAGEISPLWHVRMQAAFQKHTDNAVSKTINFPTDAKRKDVKDAFLLAYRLGCKGITVYRDRSRVSQVL